MGALFFTIRAAPERKASQTQGIKEVTTHYKFLTQFSQPSDLIGLFIFQPVLLAARPTPGFGAGSVTLLPEHRVQGQTAGHEWWFTGWSINLFKLFHIGGKCSQMNKKMGVSAELVQQFCFWACSYRKTVGKNLLPSFVFFQSSMIFFPFTS